LIPFFKLRNALPIALLTLNGYALTLDEALSTTLHNSTDLQKMQMGVDISAHDLKQKKAMNYGRVDVMASYTHYNLPRTLTPLTPASMASGAAKIPTTKDMMIVGAAYNVSLFDGMATTRSIEISKLQKSLSKKMQKLTKEQLIYNVKTLYFNILSLDAKEQAQKSYIKALQKLHDDIVLRVELGSAAQLDALKSEADVSRAVSALQEIQTNKEILKDTLASVMMVREVDDLQKIEIDVLPLEETAQYDEEILHTTRLQIAELDIEKKQKIKEKTDALYYPKINFNAYYGLNSGVNDSTNPNSGDFESEDVWQAGVDLKWNVFDFGSKSAALQKSKIAMMQSKLDKAKAKRDAQRSLKEALSKISLAIAKFHNAQTELSLMTETRKIEELRYNSGASDINDLLYAEARYQLSKSAYIDAKYSYQNARNYLDYILEKGNK